MRRQQQHRRPKAGLAAWGLGCALLLAGPAWAQAPAAAASSATPAVASSPAKKELVARILKLQQPVIEGLAQSLAEQPAAQLMQQAGIALQSQVSMDKREEIGNGIKADVKAYLDETAPLLKDKAVRLAPTTVGALLEEKFTEDELKQLLAILESPVNRRLQELGGDMQRVLRDKLIADARPEVEPKVRVLQQNLAKRLGANAAAPAASAPAPAPAASKPRAAARPAAAASK